MKAEEDDMSDTLPGRQDTEHRDGDGDEIRESPADSSPEMQSRFHAASMQRRSSLPVSIDSAPRSYRRSQPAFSSSSTWPLCIFAILPSHRLLSSEGINLIPISVFCQAISSHYIIHTAVKSAKPGVPAARDTFCIKQTDWV